MGAFPSRTAADVEGLPAPARSLLLGLHALNDGATLEMGQDALAKALRLSLRTLQRWTRYLDENGFLVIRRAGYATPWQVFVHPVVVNAVEIIPTAPEPIAAPTLVPVPKAGRLRNDSLAIRCARVRRPDGSRYLPVPYVARLLSDKERALCAYAAATNAGPVCDDLDLSDALLKWFRHLAWWQRHRTSELVMAAILHETFVQKDVPAFIDDEAA